MVVALENGEKDYLKNSVNPENYKGKSCASGRAQKMWPLVWTLYLFSWELCILIAFKGNQSALK
jgi:hypothetical protein